EHDPDRAPGHDRHRDLGRSAPGAPRRAARSGERTAMKLRRSARTSIEALFAHKVRALLALSSVTVGVMAVVLTGAIGAGAQRDVARKLEAIGTNLIVVRPAQVQRLASRKAMA